MEQTEYFDTFENNLLTELLKLCTSHEMLSGTLLSSEDIDARWKEYAPEYMADAVPQVNSYPAAAMAWAGYVGMAVAHWWDTAWEEKATAPYSELHGAAGFDDMDEKIAQEILGLSLESEEYGKIEQILRSCAHTAMNMIRREDTEAQTTKAFYLFARTTRTLFRIGAALELKRLGYKFEKVQLD
ncbi:MAG: hypothetical protein IKZ12_02520 [Alistipes sp.]|nr:hypothetical protein [Alistipes sp.]